MDYGRFLNIVQNNLAANRCRIKHSVPLDGRVYSDLVAQRWYMTQGIHVVCQMTFVTKFNDPQLQDLVALRKAQLEYVRKTHWFSFLRGLQFTYSIINCVVADAAPSLVKVASNRPMPQRGLVELPVIFETNWGQAHYFKGKLNLVSVADAQQLIAACIEGARPKAATTLIPKAVRA